MKQAPGDLTNVAEAELQRYYADAMELRMRATAFEGRTHASMEIKRIGDERQRRVPPVTRPL